MAMMDARLETGQARAAGEAARTFGGMRIQLDQPHKPTQMPQSFERAISAGLMVPGHLKGTVTVEVEGKEVLAKAGEPFRLGRFVRDSRDRCSYEPVTPLRHLSSWEVTQS